MRETEQAALVDILQEVATTFGDEVHTRLESSDPTGPVLPRPVAEAFAGAVAEALRNVVRHSGTRIASVRVHRGKRRIVVEVSDDGVGTGADYRPGFGIALSIRDRMREVGGDARVSPRPTGGTLVQLTWPVSSAVPDGLGVSYATTLDATGDLRAMSYAGLSLLACNIYLAARHGWHAPSPTASFALASALTLITVLTNRLLTRRSPRARDLWLLSLVMAGCSTMGLLLAGQGALLSFDSWVIGFAGLPLTLVSYVVTARWLPVLIVPSLVVVAGGIAVDPSATLGPALGAVIACSAPTLVVWSVGASVRRSTRALDRARVRLVNALVAAKHSDVVLRTQQLYLDHATREIVPFLREIASGERARDAAARDCAQILGRAARDDLYLPGFFDPSLRSAVSEHRRTGGRVELRAGIEHESLRTVSTRALLAILSDHESSSCQLTVSPDPSRPGVRIAVLPPIDSARRARLIHTLAPSSVEFESDAIGTVIRCSSAPESGMPMDDRKGVGRNDDDPAT